MNTIKKLLLLLLLIAGIVIGCEKAPEIEPEDDKADALTIKVNEFINTAMNDVYLWYKEMPEIDYRYEYDSKTYFDKLVYTEDKWSFVTDDVSSLEDSFEGIEKAYGWSLAFGRFSDTQTLFALVEFVYPETPAERIGAKRGDMIYELNGGDITEENYLKLLNGDNLTFTSGQYTNGGISNVKTSSITAEELNLDPVQFTNVIEHDGHKIGYLFYAQYIEKYNYSLDTVFQYFLEQEVTDVVLDLRYNPGGTTLAAQHLCSSLAPIDVVNDSKTLVSFMWNDKYQQYWEEGNVTNQLRIPFINSVPFKMGYNKLHILTGSGSASASELTITGLKAWMDVTTIGSTTFGKYTASITLKPDDYYDESSYYNEFNNWGLQPIILRYANAQGVTDFKDGFIADIPADDDLFDPTPLGDKNEVLLKAAIEDITGSQIVAMKSERIKVPYTIFDRGFSKYDANKRELLYNHEKLNLLK